MKKTIKQEPSATATSSRRRPDDRMTTAEISRLREQKRLHRHMVTGLIGLGLMAGGAAMYFSPNAQASDDLVVYEMDDSQIVDNLIPISANLPEPDIQTGGTLMAESAIASDAEPHPDFLSISEEEATSRAESVNENDLPEDGSYDPSTLVVNLASDTTQEDVNAVVVQAGCDVATMISPCTGRFGASFTVNVPEGKTIFELYKELLANPKVESCGFNIYFDQQSVTQEGSFSSDIPMEATDGVPSGTDANIAPRDDRSVFDDPDETFVDLNEGATMDAESSDGWAISPVDDDPAGASKNRWEYKHLRYEDVWNVTRTNQRVTVAVIDSGVMETHKDLKNLIYRPIHVDRNGVVTNGQQNDPNDNGHGTHVAGIIAAQANNKFGIAGLSYNSRIMPIQLESVDSNGRITSASVLGAFNAIASINNANNAQATSLAQTQIAKAKEQGANVDEEAILSENLTLAQRNNVRVVNISLGNPVSESVGNKWVKETKAAMAKLNESGTLVVAAAGNQTSSATVPYLSVPAYQGSDASGAPENLLSVINLEADANDPDGAAPHRKETSNYNRPGRRDCEISAPGTRIYSAHNTNDKSYTYRDGTSQAAPIVSATAALVFAANPLLTPTQAKSIICETATDLGPAGFDDEYGYGEVNPLEAVKKAKEGSKIDRMINIGKENSAQLSVLKLSICGNVRNDFRYDQVAYDVVYNGMLQAIPNIKNDIAFTNLNELPWLAGSFRLGDYEYSNEMEDAANGVKYREVSQVLSFIFYPKGTSLTDQDTLLGIYAFYVRFNLVTGTLSAEDDSEPSQSDPNEVINTSETVARAPEELKDVFLMSGAGAIEGFDPNGVGTMQQIQVAKKAFLTTAPTMTNLPQGYACVSEEKGEIQHHDSINVNGTDLQDVYTREYLVTVSNYLESYDYPVTLCYKQDGNSISLVTTQDKMVEGDVTNFTPSRTAFYKVDSNEEVNELRILQDQEDIDASVTPTGESVTGVLQLPGETSVQACYKTYKVSIGSAEYTICLYHPEVQGATDSTSPVYNVAPAEPLSNHEPMMNQSFSTATDPDAGFGDWGQTSENPDSSWEVLKQAKCIINGNVYSAFNYKVNDYIIYFKVGSTLPLTPQITNLPQGWSQIRSNGSDLPKSPQYPYGGKKYSVVVGNSVQSRQYDFNYAFNESTNTIGGKNSGHTSSAQAGKTTTTQTGGKTTTTPTTTTPSNGKATPVADKPAPVTTTYVTDDGQEETTTSPIEIGGLVGQETPEVNAANGDDEGTQEQKTSTTAPVQWKPTTGTSSETPGKIIADTSPLENIVSGGTLTKTGDAVVIVTGGIISVFSLASIIIARRRLKLVA